MTLAFDASGLNVGATSIKVTSPSTHIELSASKLFGAEVNEARYLSKGSFAEVFVLSFSEHLPSIAAKKYSDEYYAEQDFRSFTALHEQAGRILHGNIVKVLGIDRNLLFLQFIENAVTVEDYLRTAIDPEAARAVLKTYIDFIGSIMEAMQAKFGDNLDLALNRHYLPSAHPYRDQLTWSSCELKPDADESMSQECGRMLIVPHPRNVLVTPEHNLWLIDPR
jgi:hypothetical protein